MPTLPHPTRRPRMALPWSTPEQCAGCVLADGPLPTRADLDFDDEQASGCRCSHWALSNPERGCTPARAVEQPEGGSSSAAAQP